MRIKIKWGYPTLHGKSLFLSDLEYLVINEKSYFWSLMSFCFGTSMSFDSILLKGLVCQFFYDVICQFYILNLKDQIQYL